MSACEWCNLSDEDKKYILFEDEHWAVYLADKQDYVGRCIIVLKRHAGTLSELSVAEWTDFQSIIQRVESCLKTTLGADLCNWTCLLNNFYKDDNPNPHVHLHCRPRYSVKRRIMGGGFSELFSEISPPARRSQFRSITFLPELQLIFVGLFQ
ncbi:HIT family protein [Butyrivibrio sp. YAB3001]|uniref:HIT family protein n=1 Tax=Butyrivibrio sp. YAB3001 TaxID=1520812 RepID=UPI0008F68CDA|nr:HIT family protein [Butyrivibrio sp. YAB3001]SFC62749.1 Diadenosine tetraphosphate (Ap4A) hydrolase [Butyrivibrio sp. YAB3001]